MDNDKFKKTGVDQPLGAVINALVQGIKNLEQENARYADVKAKEAEIDAKLKELHELELDLKRKERDMREHPEKAIFDGPALCLWEVNYRVVDPPEEMKCSKCDDAGYIHYLSPNGTPVRERCCCRWDHQEYFARRTRLVELHISNGNEPVLFYKPEDDRDQFATIMLDRDHRIYDGKQKFEELDPFRLLFRDEATAKAYAEWCNEHRQTCVYNRDIRYEG